MRKHQSVRRWLGWAAAMLLAMGTVEAAEQARVAEGTLRGTLSADQKVRIFKGVPFATPPVGGLRWKAPEPPKPWEGVRDATKFGARCMQGRIFSDMVFRDDGPSENCLYLNVWTPAGAGAKKLPVMVWVYGGGFTAGAGSEPRQDGEVLAHKGVVVVNLNYRLGIFGFFAHPDLAKESGHDSAGNYGLLDQVAALKWVQKNIGAFGGDPGNVTIFGESAGSFSVSALMASPLAQGLFARAIGESGAFFSATLGAPSLADSEEQGTKFMRTIGVNSLEALRAKSADELLATNLKQRAYRFSANVDGSFLPEEVTAIFAAGKQSHVPLMAGWNADEGNARSIFESQPPTLVNYQTRIKAMFGQHADDVLKAYPASNDDEAKQAAQALAGDQFIGFSTWRWLQAQNATGGAPVYRYRFEDAPPVAADDHEAGAASRGAYHSAEIEFVFGALPSKHLPWRPEDTGLSELMMSYWSNFAKESDPNGAGLPEWPVYKKETGFQVMHLNKDAHAAAEQDRGRYEALESLSSSRGTPAP